MAEDWNQQIIAEFRANEGKVGGPFEGSPMLLLHTVGARSGKERVSPMMYDTDGDRILVFASNAGDDKHPSWYHNLTANPEVTVEVGTEKFGATAAELDRETRDRRYADWSERYPGFAEYEQKTTRVIPVIALTRAG